MTFTEKRPGHCIGCLTPVYEIAPNGAVGRMLDEGTQVEFLLSDGTEADIACCVTCAGQLRPEHYLSVWNTVLAATATLHAARPNHRALALAQLAPIFPVAVLRWRREDPARPGRMTVDRRRAA